MYSVLFIAISFYCFSVPYFLRFGYAETSLLQKEMAALTRRAAIAKVDDISDYIHNSPSHRLCVLLCGKHYISIYHRNKQMTIYIKLWWAKL